MHRARFARLALTLAALLLGGGLWMGRRSAAPPAFAAPANEGRPTPGQLTILGKDGKPAGLCPLRHTDVTADIAGYVARVTVTQEFHNPTRTPIEAVYTFPLPDDAAVDDMTMRIGNRTIHGEIKRREEAREIYEAAKSQGKAAALLDQERPNIFTQAVANILPGDRVRITIRYVNLLKYDEGRYEFAFPMVVGPRFVPGGGYTTPGKRGEPSPVKKIEGDPGATSVVTDAEKITPPITPPGTRAGHDISLTVNLDAGLPLGEVRSPLHAVDVRRIAPTRAVVRLRGENEIPNKDFILRYTAAGSAIQSGMLAYAPGKSGGYFTLIVQPPLSPPRDSITPKEMVFVIDQTGSQSGWPIAKAKETMRYCIQNLNPGDTFQLIGFNTDIYPCFEAPVPATAETVAKALAFLAPIEGSGGTDILKSIDYALKLPDDPEGRLRVICYLTDGYVGNDMQIIEHVGKNRGRARVFPFGVGNSVNRFLIEGMAREGRGQTEYVTLDTPGEAPAARFYRRVADPVLLDVAVDWNGLPVEDIYPRHIPDVFSAGPIVLKGRYTRAGEGDITIRGLLRGQPWSQTLHVTFPAVKADGGAIATLWAREKIEDLQAQDWVGAQTNSPKPDIQEQIVNVALEYRLMSQHTSFVAVEERVINVGGKQRTLDVPVEMPEGVSYEGIFGNEKEEQEVLARRSLGRGVMLSAATATRAGRGRGAMSLGVPVGGVGGGAGGRVAAPPPVAAKPATVNAPTAAGIPARPGLSTLSVDADDSAVAGESLKEIAEGTKDAQKRLDALKPEDRRTLLRQVKLAPALRESIGKPHKATDRIEVQIWLNTLPPEGLAKLKALGFTLSATLTPGKLLLGTVAVNKLDALIALPWVRRVEPPRFR